MSWKENNNKLEKTFELQSFSQIIEKLQALSVICDKFAHHPDFKVFDYKKICFSMCTYDAGNIVTQKDYDLSKRIDELFIV